MNKNDLVITSGIGCSARISGFVDFHSLHTLHGRALAFVTGVKLSRPELTLIVPIGGNHFIHAARRNNDITAIVMNNRIYGMTGGQFSPLSGAGILATTAPCSTIARSTTYHALETIDLLKRAISHKGFAVIEILAQRPTCFGRKNREGEAAVIHEGINAVQSQSYGAAARGGATRSDVTFFRKTRSISREWSSPISWSA